jgi:enoyl-[acyl-carrier protein] reductase I
MIGIDLSGKRALVAGVADDAGYGFAIAKALHRAGASVCLGVWPPALGILTRLLKMGKLAASLAQPDGRSVEFERIYPYDAEFDTFEEVPEATRNSKRYMELGDVSTSGLANRLKEDFGPNCLDIVIHSLAGSPEPRNPLLETSRDGYARTVTITSYSFTSLVRRTGDLVKPPGSFLALSYLAGNRVIPAYGGGLSSAKAALENDGRALAFEAGRKWGHRVNIISAGPLRSRAAQAVGPIELMIEFCKLNSPLPESVAAEEVALTAAFLSSPLASGVTGETIFVDKGYNIMGMPVAAPKDAQLG